MKNQRSGSRGAITIPMLISCILLTVAGLGTWGFLRNWRKLAETQLRLDRCTQQAALKLKRTQELIVRTNAEIHGVRALILAGTLQPPAIAALQAAAQSLVLRQDAALLLWQAHQAAWLLPNHCGAWGDGRLPLPQLAWVRPPMDPIGPMPLSWETMPDSFDIRATHFPRHSVARITHRGENHDEQPVSITTAQSWSAKWVSPE